MTNVMQDLSVDDALVGLFESNRELLNADSASFINEARDLAIKEFQRQGVPNLKVENYKYTDLLKIFQKNTYRRVFEYEKMKVNLHEVFQCDVPELDTHLVLLVNGWYYARNQKLGQFPEGVIVSSLKEAAIKHPELVEPYYGKFADPASDPMTALNTAFAQDGVFIHVPKNVVVEKPIQVINLLRDDNDLYATQRNLIVAGTNSEVKVIFCDHTLNPQHFMINNLTEVEVGENAFVDVYNIQNQHNKSANITGLYSHLNQDANLLTNTVTLHGGVVRNNLSAVLDGENAEANIYGISLIDKTQHADNFTFIDHVKSNCRSNQVYKNVLDDSATGGFTGRIHVKRDAQKTAAFQRNNNVLLSSTAKMNTKPQLVIDADDVKCSHGATVGQIDLDALFYLMARGIPEKEARLMLMFAFAHEVLQEVRVEPLRERIDELIDKRLRGEVSKCHSCVMDCSE